MCLYRFTAVTLLLLYIRALNATSRDTSGVPPQERAAYAYVYDPQGRITQNTAARATEPEDESQGMFMHFAYCSSPSFYEADPRDNQHLRH
jgi:hypothetical protein